jgi:hypothetical protein
MSYWASEIEWPVIRHSKEKNEGMFRKRERERVSETLRVADAQKDLVVVAVCQCPN